MDSSACDEKPPLSTVLYLLRRLLRDLGADLLDLYTLDRRGNGEGFAFFSKTLPSLGKAFDMGLGSSTFKLPTSFKKWKRATEIPAFLGSFFRRVFRETGELLPNADPSAVRAIRQVCFFFYKYVTPFSRESVDEGYRKWIEVDNQMIESFSIENDRVLDRAINLTEDVFGDFSFGDVINKHGPGAVSNCQRIDKHTYLPSSNDPIFASLPLYGTYLLSSESASSEFKLFKGCFSLELHSAISSIYQGISPWDFARYVRERLKLDISSRLITVPKDSRGGRIINVEPVHHQWYQQGIQRWTVDRIEKHRYSRGSVNFVDQSVNRDLAVLASLTGELATVDLKEASDRTANALVLKLFSKCPEYLSALQSTRTNFTRVPFSKGTQVVRIKKFAAMGSAVCFTTLAWSIYVLLVSALMEHGWLLSEAKANVHVYGDDIVIPKRAFVYLSSILHQYGFLVNKEKSFVGSRFAESCGMDAFDGECVTPARARALVPPKSRKLAVKSFEALESERIVKTVKLANQLQERGYSNAAETCYSLVEGWLGSPLPYGTEESPYLCRLCKQHEVVWLNESKGLFREWRINSYGEFSCDIHSRMENFRNNRLGRIRVYSVRARVTPGTETPYSRLRRILPTMGSPEKTGLPPWGIYSDRGLTVERRYIWLDIAGYPHTGVKGRRCPYPTVLKRIPREGSGVKFALLTLPIRLLTSITVEIPDARLIASEMRRHSIGR